jgi:hypothetical protein
MPYLFPDARDRRHWIFAAQSFQKMNRDNG